MNARQLWKSSEDLATECLHHPFVQGIASGDLSRTSFEFYVGQDAFFLESFARAYALALAKATDQESMTELLQLLQGALDELNLHRKYAERWGVDLEPKPASATRAYTDFLLRVAWSEPLPAIMAAMMPCMRLYSFLGKSLVCAVNPQSPYREWVETYSDDGFAALAERLETLYDRHAAGEGNAAGLYRTAMELELGFFQQAHEYSSP